MFNSHQNSSAIKKVNSATTNYRILLGLPRWFFFVLRLSSRVEHIPPTSRKRCHSNEKLRLVTLTDIHHRTLSVSMLCPDKQRANEHFTVIKLNFYSFYGSIRTLSERNLFSQVPLVACDFVKQPYAAYLPYIVDTNVSIFYLS